MKPVVLFVDDEPNILSGLRRMMRTQRDAWDMRFVEGGPAALQVLENEAVDAVVSDMRMPGVDGATLMERVAAVAPGAIRVILSGEADRGLACRTVGRSHRFLAKPCDAAAIAASVNAPLVQRARLANALQGVADVDVCTLWTPHDACARLADIARAPSPDLDAFAAEARDDPAVAARVLQLANSAYFGRPRRTAGIVEATRHLGAEVLRDLALDGRLATPGPCDARESRAFDAPVIAAAAEAAARARADDADLAAHAYATGLLTRLGDRLLTPKPLASDARVAAASYLCRLMGLPDRVCDALEAMAPYVAAYGSTESLNETARAITTALISAPRLKVGSAA